MNATVIKVFPVSVLILLKAVTLTGQVSFIHGRIMEEDSRWPVFRVLVQNVSSHLWTSSDTSGYFHLQAAAGDTLVFAATGYYHSMEIVSDTMLNTAVFRRFTMEPLVYPISEANVFAMGSYDQFRQKFLNLDLSQDKTVVLRRNLQQESLAEAIDAYRNIQQKQKMAGGVGIPILTPQEKERIRLREILAAENHKNQVTKKYNPGIIKKVTGITKDEEILEFMTFCGFSDEWILATNEYDLMVMIARKYEEFLRAKKGMGSERKDTIPAGHAVNLNDETC